MTREEAYNVPCPFCGKSGEKYIGVKDTIVEPRYHKDWQGGYTTLRRCWAYCRYCSAESGKQTIEAVDSEHGEDIIAAALEKWSKRYIDGEVKDWQSLN